MNNPEVLADQLTSAANISRGIVGLGSHRLSQVLSALARAVTLENHDGIDQWTFAVMEATEKLENSNKN